MNIKDLINSPIPISSLSFYKARIYKDLGAKDNRLQVRPIPELVGISTDEEENLPKFPCLFSDQVIKGKTEVDFGSESADIVGIISVPDFSYGFVLGLINYSEGNTNQPMSNTYSFNDIKKFLNDRSCLPKDFDSKNIYIQHWNEYIDETGKDQGGLVEFFNNKTGEKFIMLTSGTVFALTKEKIFLRIGKGDSNPTGGKQFSSITMEPASIRVITSSFIVDADNVKLGNHGLHLVGTYGTLIPTAVEGQNYIASQEVTF
jgi:hypothetical protein